MNSKIRNFITLFNIKNHSSIHLSEYSFHIYCISQNGKVSKNDDLNILKNELIKRFKIKVLQEIWGFCKENKNIKLLSKVFFKRNPLEEIIDKLDSISKKNRNFLKNTYYFSDVKGKNILLIGENHNEIGDTESLLILFQSLIEEKGDICIDFFIEDTFFTYIPRNKNNKNLSQIRNFFRTIEKKKEKGIRVHYVDYRLNFNFSHGFYLSMIYLFTKYEEYLLLTEQEKINLSLFFIFHDDRGENLCFNILKQMSKIKFQKYGNEIKKIIDVVKKNDISTVKTFYDYCEKSNETFFQNIFIQKKYDNIFLKQYTSMDKKFFQEEDFLNFFFRKRINFQNIFLDFFTIVRMFRNFKEKNENYPCQKKEQSLKNLVFYGGYNHSETIKNFIEEVIFKNNKNEINKSKIKISPVNKFQFPL